MKCRLCKKTFRGRSDKLFCSIACKSSYHHKLRKATNYATADIDAILHRNRSILLEILGKNLKQKKVNRKLLDAKKFNFHYMTGYYINSKNKTYNYVYDFAWMIFSDQEILIVRRSA